jgi:site-specific DNA-adenine methylase
MAYPGGKEAEGTAQKIINQQPPHDTYIEAFAGHAAVARWKRPALHTTLIDRDPDAIHWLAEHTNYNEQLLTANALEWLPAQHFDARTLIYCDPPYLLRSRIDGRARYRYEMSEEDHAYLLAILESLPCMVQISAYDDPLYSSHLQGWRHITFKSTTRRGLATEHLWMNYPEPKALHTYTHLGANYRERERIKRKTHRWQLRLASLPPLERLALYSALSETLSSTGPLDLATS